jgi:hypothetical protein
MKPAAPGMKKSDKRLSKLFFFLFLIFLAIIKFVYHEFWKDEWQAWFIATDTHSLSELWEILPTEGHPVLWFLLLRMVHGIGALLIPTIPAEYLIQTIHFLCVAGAAWFLFLRFRFSPWIKLGFALSYFFFFEYGVINRGYILVVLLVFWLTTLIENAERNKLLIPVLLFLLCQTEVYGVFAAMVIGFSLFWEFDFNAWWQSLKDRVWILFSLVAGIVVFLISVWSGGGYIQSPQGEAHGLLDNFCALYSNTLCIGLDPPESSGAGVFSLLFSVLLLFLIVVFFRENKKWLFPFLLFSALLLIFGTWIYRGGPRQWGIHLMFLVAMMNFADMNREKKRTYFACITLTGLILLAQLIHCGRIVMKEKKYLFSNAIEAGRFIKKNIPKGTAIIGINKAYCTPVIGYADHPFYSLPDRQLFSYAVFRERLYIPSMKDILDFYDGAGGKDLYVVSYKPLPADKFPSLEAVMDFSQPNIRQENYFLYQVKKK